MNIAGFQTLLNISYDTADVFVVNDLIVSGNAQLLYLSPNCPIFTDSADNLITQGPMINGQLIIGKSGSVPSINTLSSSGGIVITNGPGTINIDGSAFIQTLTAGLNIAITGTAPNFTIATVSNPVFTNETLTNTTNQIIFGPVLGPNTTLNVPTSGLLASSTCVLFAGFNSGNQWCAHSIPTNVANETASSNTGFGAQIAVNLTGTDNSLFGFATGQNLSTGLANCLYGESAGMSLTTQSYNSIFGTFAGTNVASQYNTIIGEQAVGNSSLTQDKITAVGWSAGFNANPTSPACYFGTQAGQNDVGARNTFIGASSGLGIPADINNDNTGCGYLTLTNIQTGSGNSAYGSSCLTNAQTASNCVGLGYSVALNGIADTNEIVIGALTTGYGSNTVTLGNSSITDISSVGTSYTIGFRNAPTIIYTKTQLDITATTNQILLGTTNTTTISATSPTASLVYSIGDLGANGNFVLAGTTEQNLYTQSTSRLLASAGNTAFGYEAMINHNQTSSLTDSNTAFGYECLKNAIVGTTTNNTCVGTSCGITFQNAQNNCIFGEDACIYADQPAGCICIGAGCGNNMAVGAAHIGSIYIGTLAGGNTPSSITGASSANVIIGFFSGAILATVGATTPIENTFVGDSSGRLATGCINNTFLGANSGYLGTPGSVAVTTGSNNCLVGFRSNVNSATATGRIALGQATLNTTDNTAIIGNASLTDISSMSTTCTLGNINQWSNILSKTINLSTGASVGKFWQCTNATTGAGQWATIGSDHAGPIYSTTTGNSSSTGADVMAGYGSTFNITPVTTGNIFFQMVLNSENNNVAQQTNTVRVRYNSGAIPGGGVAATGIQISIDTQSSPPVGNKLSAITVMGYVSGLTIGTRYWFDVSLSTTGGTFSIIGSSGFLNELL